MWRVRCNRCDETRTLLSRRDGRMFFVRTTFCFFAVRSSTFFSLDCGVLQCIAVLLFAILLYSNAVQCRAEECCGATCISNTNFLTPIPLPLSFTLLRIEVREIGGRKVIVFSQQQDEDTTVATIIIRASTEHVLNDVEVRLIRLTSINLPCLDLT